mmetsp:Transcript_21277/g.18887  ORF Transcript_21277/g.18887 Transcript_21277/m.18887 type:complete len:84 (-) Transcript_21277:30-281(-)
MKDLENKNRKVLLENTKLTEDLQNFKAQREANFPIDQVSYQNKIKDLELEVQELKKLINSFQTHVNFDSQNGDKDMKILEKNV